MLYLLSTFTMQHLTKPTPYVNDTHLYLGSVSQFLTENTHLCRAMSNHAITVTVNVSKYKPFISPLLRTLKHKLLS